MSSKPDCMYDIPHLDNTGSNYHDWKYRVSTVLHLRGLSGIAEGTEQCPPQTALDPKDQPATTAAYEKWQARNYQAKAEITMNLLQELLIAVILYTLASEVWNYLKECYEGKGQYMMVQLLGDIFRCTFLDTVPMENQLSQMCRKVHRLKVLGHDLKDFLIAAVIVMSLPDSYASLR